MHLTRTPLHIQLNAFNVFDVPICLYLQTSHFSPPFYTGPRGYKSCIRLYPNGDGVGFGKLTDLRMLENIEYFLRSLAIVFSLSLQELGEKISKNSGNLRDKYRKNAAKNSNIV